MPTPDPWKDASPNANTPPSVVRTFARNEPNSAPAGGLGTTASNAFPSASTGKQMQLPPEDSGGTSPGTWSHGSTSGVERWNSFVDAFNLQKPGGAPAYWNSHQQQSGWKLYSLHAPEVECIGKGKAHRPYEFGCKVSITTTNARGLDAADTNMGAGSAFDEITARRPVPVVPVFLLQPHGSLLSMHRGRFVRKWPAEWPAPVSVSFGDPPAEFLKAYEQAALVTATGMFFSQAGWELFEVWNRVKRIYEKCGAADEWRLGDQADIVEYEFGPVSLMPTSEFRLFPGVPVFWHPSVGSVMLGETVLVTERGAGRR